MLEDAASSGANEDDSAMLFYHEPSLPGSQPTGAQPSHSDTISKHRGEGDSHAWYPHPV